MREWLGDRVVNSLSAHTYVIANRAFENTVSVPRESIEDDQYSIYGPMFERLGQDAATHPDELVFGLMAAGFTTKCFDGQNFFAVNHPVGDPRAPVLVSNFSPGGGADGPVGPPWMLLDCSQAIKPFIYQERLPYVLETMQEPTNAQVFMKNKFYYGVRARCNVGLGVWQLAYASTGPLTADTYAKARASMMSQLSDTGRPLGIKPTHLVTVPANEEAALTTLKALQINATTNIWVDTAKPIVMQFLLRPDPMVAGGSAVAT